MSDSEKRAAAQRLTAGISKARVPASAKVLAWIAEMRRLALCCADAEELHVLELLVEVERAVRACPRSLRTLFEPVDTGPQSARFLAAGAHVSFALGMCSEEMSYLLSRSAAGHSLVTIALPELEQESSFVSNDLSLAVSGALLNLIADRVELQRRYKSPLSRPLN